MSILGVGVVAIMVMGLGNAARLKLLLRLLSRSKAADLGDCPLFAWQPRRTTAAANRSPPISAAGSRNEG